MRANEPPSYGQVEEAGHGTSSRRRRRSCRGRDGVGQCDIRPPKMAVDRTDDCGCNTSRRLRCAKRGNTEHLATPGRCLRIPVRLRAGCSGRHDTNATGNQTQVFRRKRCSKNCGTGPVLRYFGISAECADYQSDAEVTQPMVDMPDDANCSGTVVANELLQESATARTGNDGLP